MLTNSTHITELLQHPFWHVAYDVTRRETFESLDEIWMREVDMYSTIEDAVKMVVANKLDKVWCHIFCLPTCHLYAVCDFSDT